MSVAYTAAAYRGRRVRVEFADGVASRRQLAESGVGPDMVGAQLAAGRWRLVGQAVVLHDGPLTEVQRREVALLNCGPRAVLTSFTAAAVWGLRGWDRPDVHVLAPAYARRPELPGIRLHRTRDWSRADVVTARRLHRLAPALVLAASSFPTPRAGCGVLAAGVQQRLVRPSDLRRAAESASRTRHRAALLLAVADIEQGAQALSDIDFVRLCARYRLQPPNRQSIRMERSGRRRYLDAEWQLPDGRVVAVEVDGAVHLSPESWFDDQLRQNEVVIGGTTVLRFPSVVVRFESALVAGQLQRALGG